MRTAISLTEESAEDFVAHFTTARELTRIREATSPFTHVDGTRYFLTKDGRSGFAIRPDGELVYVFSGVRGRGDQLVAAANARGAVRLDCFDGYLTELYARHGFIETDRSRNWVPSGPDVVYMMRPTD